MAAWRRFGWAWDELGRENALGAILTKDGQVAEWNEAEFLATGRQDVDRFLADMARLAPNVARTRAMDFGCGVGRITRAMADHFDAVVGVDVAPSMIERARSLHADCRRCSFVVQRAPHLQLFPSASFSVVYSRIVLQHIRPVIVRRYIPELIRVVEPGGVLMFQLPEVVGVDSQKMFEDAPVEGNALKQRLPRPVVVGWRRLKYRLITRSATARMEMFGIEREEVEAIIKKAGGRLLEAKPDRSHGPQGQGFEYWVTPKGH
jgi:trans-aconitate methyltransferase